MCVCVCVCVCVHIYITYHIIWVKAKNALSKILTFCKILCINHSSIPLFHSFFLYIYIYIYIYIERE